MLPLITRQSLKAASSKYLLVRLASTAAPATASATTAKKSPISSLAPAGTKLKGLNIKKGGEDPVALPENEYPDWLWELLDPVAQNKRLENDLEKKAKKERRSANRQKIKMNNFLAEMKK